LQPLKVILNWVGSAIWVTSFMLMLSILLVFIGIPLFFIGLAVMQVGRGLAVMQAGSKGWRSYFSAEITPPACGHPSSGGCRDDPPRIPARSDSG
jgi:hypothetical protein